MIAFTSVTLITTTAVTLIVFAFDIVLKEGILWLLQGAGDDAMTDAVDIIEETEVVEEEEPTTSPYDLEGGWYVIHSYSGYENKVKANLETRIRSMHMEDRIFRGGDPARAGGRVQGGPEGHR